MPKNEQNVTPAGVEALRIKMGMTQYEFAILMDIQPTTVSRWENGRAIPNKWHRPKLIKLAEKHKVNIGKK